MLCKTCNREIGLAAICPNCGARLLKKPLPHHLPEGTLIGGKYRIVGVLDEGGFGITYSGYNEMLRLPVAVKEYFPHGIAYRNTMGGMEVFAGSDDSAGIYDKGRERFLREAQVLVRFNNEPGVVSAIDFVEENNTAYLVMEFLDGETLKEYLDAHGTMSAEEAFGMLEPMMRTLEKIHAAGVIHRDISPDNIMRLKNGQLKLMDFGAAREFDNNGGRSMSVLLKMGYAPEEQYRRGGEQGPWTDVYAMCATVYRCITGKTPIDSLDRLTNDMLKKPSELGAKISPALENVLMYGLALYKKDRCQSIAELLDLIEKARRSDAADRGEKAGKAPVPVKPPVKEKEKRKKGPIIAIVCLVMVIVLVVTGVVIWMNQPVADPAVTNKAGNAGAKTETGVIAVGAGDYHSAILKDDGTVTAYGYNDDGQCNVSGWTDIIDISLGDFHTVGLKKDGTVVAIGFNDDGRCDVESWTDISAVYAGGNFTIGLKKDGTVVATGGNEYGQCDVDGWTDIAAVSAGTEHVVGLKKDGTVVAAGKEDDDRCDVGDWTDITAIAAGYRHTVGLKKDGSAVATGWNEKGQCNVYGWADITAVDADGYQTLGLKKDGTVTAVGDNEKGQCDVGDWTDIIAVAAGSEHTVGLKKDGTVVATGSDKHGQIDIDV